MKRRGLHRLLPRRPPDEAGFTLAELLIAIAIETIIFGALATAFVVVLNGGTLGQREPRPSRATRASPRTTS